MKKIVSVMLAAVMVLAFAACGGGPQTAIYTMEITESGITMVDTMTLEADGDAIQKMTEEISMDFSGLDEATIEQLITTYDALVEQYNSVEGVECTAEAGDTYYTMTVVVDATGDAVTTLADMGLLAVTGDAEGGLSLKATEEALTGSGYTKLEAVEAAE